MEINRITVSAVFMTNCYILGCEKTKQAIIIDAGDEAAKILEIVDNNHYSVKYLINTHAHIDHVGAIQEIKARENALFLLHKQEKPVLDSVPKMAAVFGMKVGPMPDIDEFADSTKTYSFGDCQFKILETPGHSPGGISILFDEHVFVGDTLFCGGIGRTDIPAASHQTLIDSIKNVLFLLDEKVVVHTGHGPVTTIWQEKTSNPYLKYH